MGTWKQEDRQKDTWQRHDGDSFANCNVTVKYENGPSLDFPKTVSVDVGLALSFSWSKKFSTKYHLIVKIVISGHHKERYMFYINP